MNLPEDSEGIPVFISAQRMEGVNEKQVEAIGEAELRKRGQSISADRLLFMQDSKDLFADGAVRMEQAGNVMQGPHLKLNLDTNVGDMTQPVFHLGGNNARGNADNAHMEGKTNSTLRNVTYTTCPAGKDDWLLKMSTLEIDRNRQIGTAHNAHVEFMDVPILYTPWMDFPLNDQRKSGFLSPEFGSTVKSGSEVTLPYYLNIAPNLDATLEPRVMVKRGLLLGNELRYLEPTYSGEAHLDVLPADRIASRTRSRMTLMHVQDMGYGLSGAVNLNRVSDDAYFRDLSGTLTTTSQINLVREGVLSYAGGWWNASARLQNFQTLQDPAAPVGIPYHRLPQINLSAQSELNSDAPYYIAATQTAASLQAAHQAGPMATLTGEFVDFRHPTAVSAQRLVLYPSVSYPLLAEPGLYLTPKFGLHNTHYLMGANNTAALPDASRTVPIFSADSGIILERDWSLADQDFVQTLEPRAFYAYIPYRNQNRLPIFDSGLGGFSFAQMFTENRYIGNDRVGDTNQVTIALTSRLLDQKSGAERLNVAIGQRFSLKTPQMDPSISNKSDILAAASGRITPAWSLDSNLQYNPTQSHTENYNVAAHYQPEGGKVLNLGYRFTRASIRQMDLSTQWPLYGHWHAVARWYHSFQDSRTLELLAGLEYNESCWTVRMVAQRFPVSANEFSTGFFVQLELNDLVRVGGDPLGLLPKSIPGYIKMNEPSRAQPVQGLR
ncbi:MAG: LPS-assembly protein LptD [Gallionellaceae bacterium]|nr:LPS-assembly protein LptD [Gallionellaceae bacterium]